MSIGRGDGGLHSILRCLAVEHQIPPLRGTATKRPPARGASSGRRGRGFAGTRRRCPSSTVDRGLPSGAGTSRTPRHPVPAWSEGSPPRIEHQGRGCHPRHERELGVPFLHGQRAATLDRIGAVLGAHDLFIGQVQARSPPRRRSCSIRRAPISGSSAAGPSSAEIERHLGRGVVELGARADRRALQTEGRDHAGGVEGEGPHQCRSIDIGEQRRAILAQDARMQGDRAVSGVQGLSAPPSLGVDGATWDDEAGDVGDRVANRVAAAVAREMKRLIEVARTLGIERPRRGCREGRVRVRSPSMPQPRRSHPQGSRRGLRPTRAERRAPRPVRLGGRRGDV